MYVLWILVLLNGKPVLVAQHEDDFASRSACEHVRAEKDRLGEISGNIRWLDESQPDLYREDAEFSTSCTPSRTTVAQVLKSYHVFVKD